jgi:hypothetical protein
MTAATLVHRHTLVLACQAIVALWEELHVRACRMLINLRLIAESIREEETTLLLSSRLVDAKTVGLSACVTLYSIHS